MRGKALAVLCVISVLAAAGCGGEMPGGTGLVKITDRAYALVPADETSANGLGANSGFIVGDDAVLVIDARYTPELAAKLYEAIRSVTDKPVKYLVNTHYHPDHVWGDSFFSEKGAWIFSTPATRDDIANFSKIYLEYYKDNKPEAYEQLKNVRPVLADSTFTQRIMVDLGGIGVELIPVGPAHTAGDAIVYAPSEKVVFTGGILSNGYHANMGDQGADFDNWKKVLEGLEGMKARFFVPAQGEVCGKKALEAQDKYIDDVIRISIASIKAGKTLSQAVESAVIPGTEGFRQANILPFNIQAVYKKEVLSVVDPDFTLDLPEYFSVTDGGGDTTSGRIFWTGQNDDGYSEVEISWHPTNRKDIIIQDIHESVAKYMASRDNYDMIVEGSKKLDIEGATEKAAYGRWNYMKESKTVGGGLWTWSMIIRNGKLYSIKLSTNAGLEKDKEASNMGQMEKALSSFRLKK